MKMRLLFVTPEMTIGPETEEMTIFAGSNVGSSNMAVAGEAEEWRDQVAALCIDNPYLLFFTAASFAAPLLYFSGEQGGGFHLIGSSSIGKSTTLLVAGSVWGGGGQHPERGYTETWRTTDNALEGIAQCHNDLPLILDEISEVKPESISNIIYMLANGMAKGRANQDGSTRERGSWRTLILSSGEKTLKTVMTEIRKVPKAGQEVRLLSIPIPDSRPYGLFDRLPPDTTPERFSSLLRERATSIYGAAGMAYLEHLIDLGSDTIKARIAAIAAAFISSHALDVAHGQNKRAATRFALVLAAGCIASEAGLTGWSQEEVFKAVDYCFAQWLGQRAGLGDAEIEAGIAQVRGFVEAHGSYRFQFTEDITAVPNRVGYRRMQSEPDGPWEYLVLPEAWKKVVCAGYEPSAIYKELCDLGMARHGGDKISIRWKIRGQSVRGYHLLPSIIGTDDEEDRGRMQIVPG